MSNEDKVWTRPTDDQIQELKNCADLWLRLIDEGQIIPAFHPGRGIDPQYLRHRLNELEAALKPFPPFCLSDLPKE